MPSDSTSATRRRLLLLACGGLPLLGGAAAADTPALPRSRRLVRVAHAGALRDAAANAVPGDRVLLATGAYEGEFVLAAAGTAEAPIVVEAEEPHQARLTGHVRVTGAYGVLSRLLLERAEVELAADGARMTRCRQADTRGIAVLVSRGRAVEVDRNELFGLRGRGISVRPDGDGALPELRIHRNHVRDFVGASGENVHEAVQLGQSKRHSRVRLRAVLELNLIERVSVDSEAISIKSSDNLVRRNTLLDCRANLTNRHGERNRIEANWLERCLGIVVHDRGNEVVGNVLVDCRNGIRVMGGDVPAAEWPALGSHPAAEETLVARNVAAEVTVGRLFRGHGVPATRTRLAGQEGRIVRRDEEETSVVAPPQVEHAAQLSPAEVGPEAP
jgi:hypothetical protein